MNSTPAFPDLHSVSFDTELALSYQPHPSAYLPALQRESTLALNILAANSGDLTSELEAPLTRLEAKLDLVLELALLSHHPQRPALTPCRLGLERMAWLSKEAPTLGSQLLVSLCPQADSALRLHLLVLVESTQASHHQQTLICANIRPGLNDHTQILWEKWVFRQHRKALQGR